MTRGRGNRFQTPSEEPVDEIQSEIVQIREGSLPVRIRSGPGLSFSHVNGRYLGKGVYEVSEIVDGPGSKAGWGRLANGDGWVAMEFVEIVK